MPPRSDEDVLGTNRRQSKSPGEQEGKDEQTRNDDAANVGFVLMMNSVGLREQGEARQFNCYPSFAVSSLSFFLVSGMSE